jgi:hypothetical protein
MIVHQAVAPDFGRRPYRRLAEKIEVLLIISFLEKDWAAPVSSLGYIVRESGDNDPGSSCHAGKMPYLVDLVNCYRNCQAKWCEQPRPSYPKALAGLPRRPPEAITDVSCRLPDRRRSGLNQLRLQHDPLANQHAAVGVIPP